MIATLHAWIWLRPTLAAGDCLVSGYDPPKYAVTLQRVPESDAREPIPLLRPPQDYKLRWRDESLRADRALHIWQPVPHPGSGTLTPLPP